MSEGQEVAVRESGVATQDTLTVQGMIQQVRLIQEVMREVMKKDEHFGVIPGTDKPTLLKPGAEKLCLLFKLAPAYDVFETMEDNGHYSVRVTCTLTHAPTGNVYGSGMGYCTTHESKYAYRNQQRVCPACGIPAIIKGKAEYGGGWVCFKKKDGCGAKYQDDDPTITDQVVGKMDNPDLADSYNTVLKMGSKRALVAAVLVSTAASDIFAQDLEDLPLDQPVATADVDTLETLRAELDSAALENVDLWGPEPVMANARQRFGRNVQRIEDLTQKEAEAILSGVRAWTKKNVKTTNKVGGAAAGHDPLTDVAHPDSDRDEILEGEVVDDG